MYGVVNGQGSRVAATAPPPGRLPAEGLFVQLCLTTRQAARLRGHPLLHVLAPDAVFVGGS